jgi:hypothetical protein
MGRLPCCPTTRASVRFFIIFIRVRTPPPTCHPSSCTSVLRHVRALSYLCVSHASAVLTALPSGLPIHRAAGTAIKSRSASNDDTNKVRWFPRRDPRVSPATTSHNSTPRLSCLSCIPVCLSKERQEYLPTWMPSLFTHSFRCRTWPYTLWECTPAAARGSLNPARACVRACGCGCVGVCGWVGAFGCSR